MPDRLHDFHVWETLLYSFFNSFPYMVLVLYAFRGHHRFKKPVTCLLLLAATVFQMVIVPLRLFSANAQSPLFDIAISAVYIAFIFAAVKEHIGKLAFTVLTLTDLGNFVVVGGKCLEGLFFPEKALLRYHFTYTLFMIPVLAAVIPVIYLLVFRNICTRNASADADREIIGGFMWHYLWLIPAVFYLIWMQHFYAEGRSALENAMDPKSTAYLLIIDAGSVMIYRTIVRTAELYEKNTALLAENHALSIQRLQYDSLNERLENMRRTRHDLRHHTALLKQIRDKGDISALDELIDSYTEQNHLDQPLFFCENETLNVVLALYSETALRNDISFSVKANVPKDVFVDRNDLAVLFGNILENAADACKGSQGERFIDLNVKLSAGAGGTPSLALKVMNSFGGQPSVNENGIFRSTKHAGDGIGISSVRIITEKYGGVCSFTHEDGVFTVSVILYDTKQ